MTPRQQWVRAAGWGLVLTLAQLLLISVTATEPADPSLCFSPDSHRLAASGPDWKVRLWDLDTGKLSTIDPRMSEIVALAFSPDGARLFTAASDMGVATWNAATGTSDSWEPVMRSGVRLRTFTCDASFLASADENLCLQDLQTGQERALGVGRTVRALAFSRDGAQLACARRSGEVEIWNVKGTAPATTISIPAAIESLALSPDGKRLAVAGDAILVVYGGEAALNLSAGGGQVRRVQFSPDGRFLAGASGTSIIVWDATDGRTFQRLDGHRGPILNLAYSPDGKLLAATTGDEVITWTVADGQMTQVFRNVDRPWFAPVARVYRSIDRWDVAGYANVVEEGFHAQFPITMVYRENNVAYFPGFPLFASAVYWVLGVKAATAAALASQVAAWGFWTYLLVFFRHSGLSARVAVPAVLAIFVHPAAFYLVVGYSESLFLFGLMGFLYWQERPGPGPWILAALHGFVMTGTRMVGLPLAAIPVLRFCVNYLLPGQRGGMKAAPAAMAAMGLAGLSLLGALLFFAFCAWKFGHWNLYLLVNAAGWNAIPDYTAPFRWQIYVPLDLMDTGNQSSRLAVPIYAALFLLLMLRERRAAREPVDSGWRERLWFYFAALVTYYVPVCGFYCANMGSMIRFSFPVHVMLVLAGAHLAHRSKEVSTRERVAMLLALGATGATLLWLQCSFIHLFTAGYWVA